MRWLGGITDSMNMSLSKTPGDSEGQGSLECCSPWGRTESEHIGQRRNWATEQQVTEREGPRAKEGKKKKKPGKKCLLESSP